jgi:hypothetical protein
LAIPHVEHGKEADPDEQNALIDQVNTNTSAIAGKAAVCNTAGQDVASAGAAGSSSDASRCDHKHKGVSKIVAGTNITINPTSGVGAVTVNATAAAGGVTKVEKTFDGTFAEGEELCSDTPATDKLPVAIYYELTTTDGNLIVNDYFNDKSAFELSLDQAGMYAWGTLSLAVRFKSDDSAFYSYPPYNGWKLGYKISLKALVAGTGSGKLIIYYATIT